MQNELEYSTGMECLKQRSTGSEGPRFSTGSVVVWSAGSIVVVEDQIDFIPHPPPYCEHSQIMIKASPEYKRPKKIKLNLIKDLDHQPIKWVRV